MSPAAVHRRFENCGGRFENLYVGQSNSSVNERQISIFYMINLTTCLVIQRYQHGYHTRTPEKLDWCRGCEGLRMLQGWIGRDRVPSVSFAYLGLRVEGK